MSGTGIDAVPNLRKCPTLTLTLALPVRLRDALVPDWGAGKIGGGTTVIYDPVANGKR